MLGVRTHEKNNHGCELVVQKWLDPVQHHFTKNASGFIDAARLERHAKRIKRTWKILDEGQANWASMAVASWFVAQSDLVVADGIMGPMKLAIEKIGFGSDIPALSVIHAQACRELSLAPGMDATGGLSVAGEGLGHFVVSGLHAFARDPVPILSCLCCARSFTGRAGSKTCSDGCRTEFNRAKRELADQ